MSVFGSDFGSCSFMLRNTRLCRLHEARFVDCSISREVWRATRNWSRIRRLQCRLHRTAQPDFRRFPVVLLRIGSPTRARAHSTRFADLAAVADATTRACNSGQRHDFFGFGMKSTIHGSASVARLPEGCRSSRAKWFPYNKGGEFRKWYGNHEYVVNWDNDGQRAMSTYRSIRCRSLSTNIKHDFYFRAGITWSDVTISQHSASRHLPQRIHFDVNGPMRYSRTMTMSYSSTAGF